MKAMVLLGAPGAGKGTCAEDLRTHQSFVHVATGDILRGAVKEGTELGVEAEAFMKRGELVPDEIIARLVESRLDAGGSNDAYMFDGYPRTINQAELLKESLARRDACFEHVLYLDCPRDVLIARLTGRRTCRDCGTNFHMVNIPPKVEGVCDSCGGELYQRPDDTESTIVNRLDVFSKQTESLIAYYEKEGILSRVDSSQDRAAIVSDILGILGGNDQR